MSLSRLPFASVIVALALIGCPNTGDTSTQKETGSGDTSDDYVPPTDADSDGVTPTDGDCEDDNPDVYPGKTEECNGLDDNCNGVVDEGLDDADNDGIADCQDTETCDGVDNNGDGLVDEGYADDDGNGIADCVGSEVCDGVDNNANGQTDEGFDADGDGYTTCGTATVDPDCDDSDANVFPDAGEVAGDEADNDCDGLIDEGDWEAGDLALNEIMNNPGDVLDPDGEWFEVVNMSTRTIILNGLILAANTDSEWHQVASDELLTVEPGEFFVFGSNADFVTNGNATVDYEYDGIVLQNETDDIKLIADGIEIDSLDWDDGATMPDPSSASMGLDPANMGSENNDDPTSWCVATVEWGNPGSDFGSPNTVNELCSTYDHDGDGYSGDAGDCDDADINIYPGAFEATDGADTDCDGVVESAPTAIADYDASSLLLTCSPLTLDASASFDPDGDAMTYSWELTSAPSGSATTTADIDTTTDIMPTFHPDVAGDYIFTLTVSDAGTSSMPTSITITIGDRGYNADPVAAAGSDQSTTGTVDCTPISYGAGGYDCDPCSDYYFYVDGASSSDPDGDTLVYTWSINSDPDGVGTLSSTGTTSAQLLIDDPTATYSTGHDNSVILDLTVMDCMAASNTDQVTLTYTCTGT